MRIVPNADGQADIRSTCVLRAYECLLADISMLSRVPLGAPSDITYDWVTIEAPKLDKGLLQFIEGTGTLPEFPEWLKPLLDKFLLTLSGELLRWLRQLLLFCYKIEHEPTYEQIKEAQASFEEVENSVANWDMAFTTSQEAPLFSSARKIVGKIIYRIDWSNILPSHGPGAVYPSVLTHEKTKFDTIYTSIEPYYGFADFFCALPSFWDEYIWRGNSRIKVSDNIDCRLVAVPKDSRGPRLICVHPKEAVWIQQGCRRLLERAIEAPNSEAAGRINFHDQTINGNLALKASMDREYCTLDLKEASDRISCKLVRYLFGNHAYEYLSCSRATRVRLLDERIISLQKWAPMGNALTFPVQSLIFYSIVRAGIMCRYGTNCNDIYIFGDDIIFPVKFYDGVISALVRSGLVPNSSKTFRHGFFRESCGVDAYRGIDVTPHRLRGYDASTGSGALSMVTLAKALAMDKLHLTSEFLYREVQKHFGKLPLSNNPNAQGLYRYEECTLGKLLLYEPSLRFNQRYHKWQTKLLLVSGMIYHTPNDAWWHLQDSLISLHHQGASRLGTRGQEYAVPHRTRLKRGWADVI